MPVKISKKNVCIQRHRSLKVSSHECDRIHWPEKVQEYAAIRKADNQSTMNRTLKALVLSAGLCALPNLCFSANIVYDNTATDLSQQYFPTPNTLEFGDQISLVGSDRVLSQFNFYYFLSGTATGQSATVRMYANSGTNPPTSAFYASDPIPLAAGFNNRSEEHTSELQSHSFISYAVFCL